MKYVAFLDILGFKNYLENNNQEQAKKYIADFSESISSIWHECNTETLSGLIVSDSVILYSKDTRVESLRKLVDVIIQICKYEFVNNSILIRGALTKGNFERQNPTGEVALSKELIVGQAYVDAYHLESKIKVAGIIMNGDVYADLTETSFDESTIEELKDTTESNLYLLKLKCTPCQGQFRFLGV